MTSLFETSKLIKRFKGDSLKIAKHLGYNFDKDYTQDITFAVEWAYEDALPNGYFAGKFDESIAAYIGALWDDKDMYRN